MSIDGKDYYWQDDASSNLSLLLSELSHGEDLFLLCQALFHEDADVVVGAALVLGRIKDLRSLPYILRALLTTDQRRAQALMWAAGELGDESATGVLLEALNANFLPKNALQALGKIGSFRALEALSARLNDEDESLRALAAKILCQYFVTNKLASHISEHIDRRLLEESSRRVRLLLAVLKRKLEQMDQ